MSGSSGRLPSGRHGLSPEYVVAHQRERLLSAVRDSCATRGYAATTIAHVVREARVSPRTFYRHFAGKEECFLAAYSDCLEELERRVTQAMAQEESREWPEQIGAGLRVLLDDLAVHPSLARTVFVDVLSAGPSALATRERALARARRLLAIPAGAPPEAAEAAVGGIAETIYYVVLNGDSGDLPAMWGEFLYCLLVGLIGHERAWRLSQGSDGGSSEQ